MQMRENQENVQKNFETSETTAVNSEAKDDITKNPEYLKIKANMDKYASEIAELKRKERARMTEEEVKQQKQLEKEEELERLRKQVKVSEINSSLVDFGLENPSETAEKLLEGDYKTAITNVSNAFSNKIKELQDKIKTLELSQMGIAGRPQAGTAISEVENIKEQYKKAVASKDSAMAAMIMRIALEKGYSI